MDLDKVTPTRRDLLKKLAAASATAGVAATVISSTAFADGGTINSLPAGTAGTTASLAVQTLTNTVVTFGPDVILAAVTCPFQPATPPKVEYAWESTQPASNAGDPISITSPLPGFSTTLLDVTLTATTPGSSRFVSTFTLSLTVRWTCPQRPPRQPSVAWRCVTFAATISRNTNGNLLGFGSFTPTTQSSSICDASTPTLP